MSWYQKKVSSPNITITTNSTNIWTCMLTSTSVTHSHPLTINTTTLTSPSSEKILKENSQESNIKSTQELWNHWKSQPEPTQKDWSNMLSNSLIWVEERKFQSFTRPTSWNSSMVFSCKSPEKSLKNIHSLNTKKWLLITVQCNWSRTHLNLTSWLPLTFTEPSSLTFVQVNYHFDSGITGGVGMTPGACIGKDNALFSQGMPHSGMSIAGKNVANPTSMLLSSVMMLRYLGLPRFADQISSALNEVLT